MSKFNEGGICADHFPAMYGGMNPAINRASDISPETNDPKPDLGAVMLEIAIMKCEIESLKTHIEDFARNLKG